MINEKEEYFDFDSTPRNGSLQSSPDKHPNHNTAADTPSLNQMMQAIQHPMGGLFKTLQQVSDMQVSVGGSYDGQVFDIDNSTTYRKVSTYNKEHMVKRYQLEADYHIDTWNNAEDHITERSDDDEDESDLESQNLGEDDYNNLEIQYDNVKDSYVNLNNVSGHEIDSDERIT